VKTNDDYDPADAASILKKAKKLEKKSLSDFVSIDPVYKSVSRRNTKGSLGTIIERYYFGICPDNISGLPDFPKAKVELKSTGMIEKDGSLKSKERLVLGMIDFEKIAKERFEESDFLKKNNLLLLIFYLYDASKDVVDQDILLADLWSIPDSDIALIRNDWETIRRRICNGEAHEISESDTLYLRACTKGADSTKLRSQPFSSEKAKSRAFSYNPRYLDSIFSRIKGSRNDSKTDSIVKDPSELEGRSFEDIVISRFKPYYGRDVETISRDLGIGWNPLAKNMNAVLTRRILNVSNSIAEFDKAGIMVRSIKLEKSGNLVESVSLPSFDYCEIVEEQDWDGSELRDQLSSRFFFVVYQMANHAKVLKQVKFWSMPESDLDQNCMATWEETRRRIRAGNTDQLPKISEGPVIHVRPHGRNKEDKIPTPTGGTDTRKCFFINAKYLKAQIFDSSLSDYM
jgi:DNA mismatch repair protein MutH